MWVYAGSRTVVYRDRAEAAALDESQRALWANDRQLAWRAANNSLRRLRTQTLTLPLTLALTLTLTLALTLTPTLSLTLTLALAFAACRLWREPPRRGAPV